MNLIPVWLIALLAAGAGAALAGGAQQLRLSGLEAEHARYREQQALKLAEAEGLARRYGDALLVVVDNTRQIVADADASIERARNEAQTELARRAPAIAAGAVRVRYVAAACPKSGGDVPGDSAAAGVADGAGVELAPTAGLDVLVFRQSVTDDRTQIEGWKQYGRAIAAYNAAVKKLGAEQGKAGDGDH